MARYSDKEVYGTLDIRNAIVASEVEIKIMDPNSYYQDVRVLFDNLTHGIAKDKFGGEFLTGKRAGNFFWTIYGLVQCSPDLNKQQCLEIAATSIPVICKDWDRQSALPTKTRQPGYQERQVIYLSGLASLGSSLFPYLS
ncbi:hypothetical protein LguiA_026115 [Lonicera macranthoides]